MRADLTTNLSKVNLTRAYLYLDNGAWVTGFSNTRYAALLTHACTHEPSPDPLVPSNNKYRASILSGRIFPFFLLPLFIFEAMRLLPPRPCSQIIIITILFSVYACARPKIVVSRECESAWCVNVPSLPWDSLLGAGSAAVGAFEGILNSFVKPQLPTSPTPSTNEDGGDDDHEDSDERARPDSDMESGLSGSSQNQCQNNLLDLQPGEVSFFLLIFAVSVPLIRGIKKKLIF